MELNRHAVSMYNSEASVRMEGYDVTPEMRRQCEQVLRGEISTADCLRRFATGYNKEPVHGVQH